MAFYGFKPNPKQLVVNKAHALFGNEVDVQVTGERPSVDRCRELKLQLGVYYVECIINGKIIATCNARDWRKAYRALVVEVEKAYERALTDAPEQV